MKKLFAGLVAGFVVAMTSTAFASNIDEVNVVDYTIRLNDLDFTPTNRVLSVGGVTYIPLRETFETLGYTVIWNGDGTIDMYKPLVYVQTQTGVFPLDEETLRHMLDLLYLETSSPTTLNENLCNDTGHDAPE